jgi:hypothetical protein
MALLDIDTLSKNLGIAKRTLSDKRWRARVGLPIVKIGARVYFDSWDVSDWIRCRKEKRGEVARQRVVARRQD